MPPGRAHKAPSEQTIDTAINAIPITCLNQNTVLAVGGHVRYLCASVTVVRLSYVHVCSYEETTIRVGGWVGR